MKNFLYSFCSLFFSLTLLAQELPFQNFLHADGLPSNEVYDIFQDKNGCMWFATDRGIAQYNGYEFKTYETVHGLTDICVFDFFLQPNGQVWCSTFTNQLFYFENGKNKFIPYKYNNRLIEYLKKGGLKRLVIKKIMVDSDQTVYITDFRHTFKIDAQGKITIFQKFEFGTDLKNYNLNTLKLRNNQKLNYLTNKKAQLKLDLNHGNRIGIVNLNPNKRLIATDTVIIFEINKKIAKQYDPKLEFIECGIYNKQLFWIGFRANGVKVFNDNGKEVQHYLKKHSVTKLLKDSYGGIWISTLDAGVFYLKKNLIQSNNLKEVPINSLTVDNKDNLFIGGIKGNVYSKSYQEKFYKTILNSSDNSFSFVQYHTQTRQVYFLADYKLHYNGNVFETKSYTKLIDDRDTKLLVLYGNSDIRTFNPRTKKLRESIFTFKVLDVSMVKNQYFVGTLFGLKTIDNNKVYAYTNNLLKSRIEDIDYDKRKQTLYMASLGKGVLVYNLKKKTVFSIDKSKGLSSNLVNEVYIQNENTIWAGTNYGLNKISFDQKGRFKVKYITSANGLPNDQVKKVQILKDSIYIGTSKGLNTLAIKDFDDLFKNKRYFLNLKEITVNNKVIPLRNNLKLSYNENDLSFFVEGVSFSSNSQIFYKYKMHGLDKEWHYTKNRKIAYEYLPPGTYTFTAQIMEDNKILSKELINLPIIIYPPFWKTSWFIILVSAALGVLIYLFFKIRVFTYNVDIVRELLRLLVKKITKKELYFSFKEQGNEVRVKTQSILYVKSSGNYIELVTLNKTYTIRSKISDFFVNVPDPLEFLRIHRSYIVRIDKVEKKTKKSIFINQEEIPVGETYLEVLDKIIF